MKWKCAVMITPPTRSFSSEIRSRKRKQGVCWRPFGVKLYSGWPEPLACSCWWGRTRTEEVCRYSRYRRLLPFHSFDYWKLFVCRKLFVCTSVITENCLFAQVREFLECVDWSALLNFKFNQRFGLTKSGNQLPHSKKFALNPHNTCTRAQRNGLFWCTTKNHSLEDCQLKVNNLCK